MLCTDSTEVWQEVFDNEVKFILLSFGIKFIAVYFLQAKRQKLIAKYRFEGKVCMPKLKLCKFRSFKVSVNFALFMKFETDNLKQLQTCSFLSFLTLQELVISFSKVLSRLKEFEFCFDCMIR